MSHPSSHVLESHEAVNPRLWWVLGRDWDAAGLRQPGWLLMPLRAFLGITFVVAAVQKLSNPSFFDSSAPTSVQAQMRAVAPGSPIGRLVDLSLHAGWGIGLVIAIAELAVGLGTLVGMRARLAASGGALLSLTFFLTVSWNTSPYYYGADIVFLFAWTPFIAMGAHGVLSLDALITRPRGTSRGQAPPATRDQVLERRALIGVGTAAVLLAGVSAVVGRLGGGSTSSPGQPAAKAGPRPRHPHSPDRTPKTSRARRPAGLTPVTAVSAVAIGQGHLFKDPATGRPAWLVRTSSSTFKAFSAVCTHAGCTVNYDSSASEFVCPCHGGVYQAGTGRVVSGPPPQSLQAIPVTVQTGTVYVK